MAIKNNCILKNVSWIQLQIGQAPLSSTFSLLVYSSLDIVTQARWSVDVKHTTKHQDQHLRVRKHQFNAEHLLHLPAHKEHNSKKLRQIP